MCFKAGVALSRFCAEEEVEAGSLLRVRNLAKLGRCESGRKVGNLRSERLFSGKLNVWELEMGKVRCCEISGEFKAELENRVDTMRIGTLKFTTTFPATFFPTYIIVQILLSIIFNS